jgi:hypothetical protein
MDGVAAIGLVHVPGKLVTGTRLRGLHERSTDHEATPQRARMAAKAA